MYRNCIILLKTCRLEGSVQLFYVACMIQKSFIVDIELLITLRDQLDVTSY